MRVVETLWKQFESNLEQRGLSFDAIKGVAADDEMIKSVIRENGFSSSTTEIMVVATEFKRRLGIVGLQDALTKFIGNFEQFMELQKQTNEAQTSFIESQTKVNETQTKVNETQANWLKISVKETILGKRNRLDVWTLSKRTKEDQQDFKDALIDFYKREDPTQRGNIFCMILDRSYPRKKIIAGHIWSSCTRGKGLKEFGLKESDLNEPRNGLLLAEAIEKAFDTKRVCFMWDPLQKQIKLCVLDPSLRNDHVLPSKSTYFKDIDGKPLHHPVDKIPFRRILKWHAELSFGEARAHHWISEEKFKELSDWNDGLSAGASVIDDLDCLDTE